MPTFEITTKTSRSVWKSPDGQREIFEIGVEYEGKPLAAKTYSRDISVPGWTGEVETYEKEGRNGPETFVKRPAKEGSYGSGGGSYSGSKRDDSHIKAQWAIGQAIAWLNVHTLPDETDMSNIEPLANDLFAMVDRVKNSLDTVVPVDDATVVDLDKGEVVSAKELDRVLGKTEEVDLEQTELPWPKK